MNKLLLDEHPLIIIPSLAVTIGLNESIFLQQLHYWLVKSDHKYENRTWVYNTLEDWNIQFPFWSVDTIKRILASLKQKNLVIIKRFNTRKYDRTNWYTIDYPPYCCF